MMKPAYSIIKSMFVALILCQAVSVYAAPTEGNHYDKITNNFTEESLGVEKFFSLTCRPCLSLSRMLPSISKQSQQTIYKTHVIFNDTTHAAATIYYSAAIQSETLPDRFISELFLLTQANAPVNGTTLTGLFNRYQLVPINKLTPEQHAQVETQLLRAEKLTAQASIMQIPTIIVNGQYQINMRAHKSLTELSDTIKQLVDLPS
ncbi:hypothetical protein FR932_13325 [Moritella marina ATCC 15381]|uniref:Thioredoxin domain-containing protein n=1 Tax=Moritella marina ATCC 15381 TaxID=1202962 RepID=A0A5J6WKW9_MORMI|nr:hypothetical protein [Moritella marina]QFI38763.1 hypothetical protein FR932_13325 [Moritella marina ATCC 15381]